MKNDRPTRRELRGNPFLEEQVHDPYRARGKLRDNTACPECGVLYRQGHWIWPTADSEAAASELCPACRRIKDRYPAGEVLLSGAFLSGHRDEVLATARNVAEAERGEHPLHRIMWIEEHDDRIQISTTDVHLPHRITHALQDAWGGDVQMHYDLDGYFARAQWERND